MLHRLANAMLIIDAYVADAGCVWPNIDEDERHLAETQILDERVLHAECEDRHAVYAALDHAPDGHFPAVGVVDRRRQQNFVVVLYGDVFKRLDDFGEEWIGDFGNDETEYSAPS